MISAKSLTIPLQTEFSDGVYTGLADSAVEKGAKAAGFGPHELLEAALATCMNMTVRVYAAKHQFALTSVKTTVRLSKVADEATFEYTVALDGELTEEARFKLLQAANACPVKRTLSRNIKFAVAQADRTVTQI